MDLERLLRQALQQQMKELEGKPFESKAEALEALNEFIKSKPDIAAGDRVERNEAGRSRYSFPQGEQVAVCIEMYEKGVSEGDDIDDMRIGVAIAKNHFKFFNVDSRYYRKIDSKVNVFKFKPAKEQ